MSEDGHGRHLSARAGGCWNGDNRQGIGDRPMILVRRRVVPHAAAHLGQRGNTFCRINHAAAAQTDHDVRIGLSRLSSTFGCQF